MGKKPLKAFKLKAFSGLLVGFESRTGHQHLAFMQKSLHKCLFACINA